MKTGALIIASGDYGEGQQDNEGIPVFLPMYPLDGTTVIKGEIAKLRKAKISPILVLAGCHSETLIPSLLRREILATGSLFRHRSSGSFRVLGRK